MLLYYIRYEITNKIKMCLLYYPKKKKKRISSSLVTFDIIVLFFGNHPRLMFDSKYASKRYFAKDVGGGEEEYAKLFCWVILPSWECLK